MRTTGGWEGGERPAFTDVQAGGCSLGPAPHGLLLWGGGRLGGAKGDSWRPQRMAMRGTCQVMVPLLGKILVVAVAWHAAACYGWTEVVGEGGDEQVPKPRCLGDCR